MATRQARPRGKGRPRPREVGLGTKLDHLAAALRDLTAYVLLLERRVPGGPRWIRRQG